MANNVQNNLAYEHFIQTAYPHMASKEDILVYPAGKRLYGFLKRLGDIVLSVMALIVLSPLFLIVAAAIKIDSKGPVIFTQQRVGKNGKLFKMYKFRSMCVDAEEKLKALTPKQYLEYIKNYKLDHDNRITRVGNFIRKASIDELPQLINILRGDLSIVGPRPVIKQELEKYGVLKPLFLSIKPGLTGYWQVNGRSAVTYEDRIRLELYYVAHCSLWMDVKIMFKTVSVVLSRKGAA